MKVTLIKMKKLLVCVVVLYAALVMIIHSQRSYTIRTKLQYNTAWLTACLFNIRSIELHTLHLNKVLLLFSFRVSAWSRSWGRQLTMSLYKLKATVTYLNWITHLNATACLHCPLHWQLTSIIQNGNQSCSWGRCHVVTAAHHYTIGQDLARTLFLYAGCTSSVHFLSNDPYHLI